jgi:hypothetical protein
VIRVIVFGVAAGAGFQAWRHYPSEGPSSQEGLFVVLVGAVVLAFLVGLGIRRARGPVAIAQAAAYAQASAVSSGNTVNLAVVVPGQGAAPVGVAVPDESMPWFQGQRTQLSLDQLEGLDVAELLEESSSDVDELTR